MHKLIAAAAIGLSLAGAALADPPKTSSAATPAKPAATAMTKTTTTANAKGGVKAADRSPVSKACSAKADAKGLHGKDRQKFRAQCMKGG